jgi:tellurite resistance protein TehA-like permease
MAKKSENAKSNISIVFGIVGMIILPIVFSSIALYQAIQAKNDSEPRATIALILASVGLAYGAYTMLSLV